MRNRYNVPSRQWKKWNATAQNVFNEVYYTMTHNQRLFLHPDDTKRKKTFWFTTAWNAAWTAADAVRQ